MHVLTLSAANGIDVEAVTLRAFNGTEQLDLGGANRFDESTGVAGFDPDGFNISPQGDVPYHPQLLANTSDPLALDMIGFGTHLVASDQVGNLPPGYNNYIVDDDGWPGVNLSWANITGFSTAPQTVTHFTWEFSHQGDPNADDAYNNNSIGFSASLIELRPDFSQVPEPSRALLLLIGVGGLLVRRRR